MKCLIATLNVRLIWKDSSTATLMNCPFIIEWSYAWIRYESDALLHSPTIHPRITAQMGQGGQGTNGLTRQEMCVLSCILLEVSSHMPSTCQGVALRGQLEDVVSSCAGNPRIWPWKKKKSWYVGYVWSSHTSWLLNVWDQSGIIWRKDVRILSLFATMHKQGSCCMCMYVSTHTEFSLSPPSSFLCSNNNNSRGTSFTVTTTPFPVWGLLFLSDDSY